MLCKIAEVSRAGCYKWDIALTVREIRKEHDTNLKDYILAITMTSVSISWANVTKPTYTAKEIGAMPSTRTPIAAEVGALATNSPMLTYIDSTGTYTVRLMQINAGKIPAAYIDTTNLSAQKIYQQGYPSNYEVLGCSYGDLEM